MELIKNTLTRLEVAALVARKIVRDDARNLLHTDITQRVLDIAPDDFTTDDIAICANQVVRHPAIRLRLRSRGH